ncbi:MAG: hypothetical protein KAI47_19010, partial [Deltaproteobacteria bacterium]|nr:hypothetical protein [Deltaproteobacteria bacterium]
MRHRWLILSASLGLLAFTAACSDDTVAPGDTGTPDTHVTEAGIDLSADMGVDATTDTTVKTDTIVTPDTVGLEAGTDLPTGDDLPTGVDLP